MANEARVTCSLQIRGGNTDYLSRPTSFQANVSSPITGPTPGIVNATQTGTIVSLALLTTPGLCRIQNLDLVNSVEMGVFDPDTNEFYPLLEFLPGESYPLRLSQFLGQELGTATTGTSSVGADQLMLRGIGGTVETLVEAFNK